MKAVREESERLRARLTAMVAEDIAAFDGLMAAYRLPKSNDEEKLRRAEAIQSNLRAATETPLACARACAEVVGLARRAAENGFAGVVSDAGVGVLAANSALRSAALNVYINAPALKDRNFADRGNRGNRNASRSLRARKRGSIRIGAQPARIAPAAPADGPLNQPSQNHSIRRSLTSFYQVGTLLLKGSFII